MRKEQNQRQLTADRKQNHKDTAAEATRTAGGGGGGGGGVSSVFQSGIKRERRKKWTQPVVLTNPRHHVEFSFL